MDDSDWLDLLGADGDDAAGGGEGGGRGAAAAAAPEDILSKAELAVIEAHEAAEKAAREQDEESEGGADGVPAPAPALVAPSAATASAAAAVVETRPPMIRKPDVGAIDAELALLLHKAPSEEAAAAAGATNAALLAALAEGRYLDVLTSPEGAALLASDGGDSGKEGGEGEGAGAGEGGQAQRVIVEDTVQKNATTFLAAAAAADETQVANTLKTLLYVGVGALQLFRQANWTGPPVNPADANDALPCIPGAATAAPALVEAEQPQNKKDVAALELIDALEVNGETAFRLVRLPALLLASRALLKIASQPCKDTAEPPPRTAGVWLARCMFAHQQVLESHVAPLHDRLFAGMATAVGSSKVS